VSIETTAKRHWVFYPEGNAIGHTNHYLAAWKSVGFRSAFMFHQLSWLRDLDIVYDASTFDIDPFEPQPDVESALIVLEPRQSGAAASGIQGGRLPASEEDDFWRLVQAAFRERRKMLKNVLVRQLPVEPARLEFALVENGIDGDRRPQTLSVEEWLGLYGSLGAVGPDVRGRRAEHARA